MDGILDIWESGEVERRWGEGEESVTAFAARAGGESLQGMLREERDPSGAIVHATLYLRPQRRLVAAIGRMGELMAEHPLPSRSS